MTYPIDDPENARSVIDRWDRGSASHFETAILDAIAHADQHHLVRLTRAYPVLVASFLNWKRGV